SRSGSTGLGCGCTNSALPHMSPRLSPGDKLNTTTAAIVILRLDRVLEGAQARALGLDEHGHVAGLVLVLPHLGVGAGYVGPRKDLGHAGIDAALDHELVGLAGLQEVGEVAALDALLPHPHEAGIERDVVAGGAGAEHDHAAALHHEAADREG